MCLLCTVIDVTVCELCRVVSVTRCCGLVKLRDGLDGGRGNITRGSDFMKQDQELTLDSGIIRIKD